MALLTRLSTIDEVPPQFYAASKGVQVGREVFAFDPMQASWAIEYASQVCVRGEFHEGREGVNELESMRELLSVTCTLLGATAESDFLKPDPDSPVGGLSEEAIEVAAKFELLSPEQRMVVLESLKKITKS